MGVFNTGAASKATLITLASWLIKQVPLVLASTQRYRSNREGQSHVEKKSGPLLPLFPLPPGQLKLFLWSDMEIVADKKTD